MCQQAVQDEARYYFTIQDFKDLIRNFGAGFVAKDLALLAPDEYDALVSAIKN